MRNVWRSSSAPATSALSSRAEAQIPPERLLDHDARPRLAVRRVQQPRLAQAFEDRRELRGRDSQVEEPAFRAGALRLSGLDRCAQRAESLGLRVVSGQRLDPRCEGRPRRGVEGLAARERLERLTQVRAVARGVLDRSAGREHPKGRRQLVALRQREERGHDLAVRQVAGRSEQHEQARVGRTGGDAGGRSRRRHRERGFHGRSILPRAPVHPKNRTVGRASAAAGQSPPPQSTRGRQNLK